MENANVIEFGSHELKLVDRREISLTGIKKSLVLIVKNFY